MFRQAGLIQVDTTEAFIDCARSLANLPLPRGNRVGIITRGGGWGVITTDACEDEGLVVPRLAPRTVEAIDRLLPPYWSRANPVDLVAVTDIGVYLDCAEILTNDPNVDGVIALGALPGRASAFLRKAEGKPTGLLGEDEMQASESMAQEAGERVIQGIISLMRATGKPVVFVGGGRDLSARFEEILGAEGLDFYSSPERAVRVMARLMEYGRYRRRGEAGPSPWTAGR
jgi:acyl-CoA synthetase (NDP forming)